MYVFHRTVVCKVVKVVPWHRVMSHYTHSLLTEPGLASLCLILLFQLHKHTHTHSPSDSATKLCWIDGVPWWRRHGTA